MSGSRVAPAILELDPVHGTLDNATAHYRKRLADLSGVYQDTRAYQEASHADPQRLMYEVHEHRSQQRPGDLVFGASVLYPGTIGDEYAMTRGHLHQIADRTEIYSCVRGHGVMLMEHTDGTVQAAEMTPNTVVYVGPHWIHRSVNVGSEPLVTLFCYPADAGQDYGIIERSGGMRSLVVATDTGDWQLRNNPNYLPRYG